MAKVLVVDDSRFIISMVSDYLKRHKWDVDACDGPFGIINKIKTFRPDLVLLDLNMPALSGNKIAQMLKESRTSLGFKVMLFSSEDEKMQQDMVSNGLADGYFVKGRSMDGLKEAIDKVVCAGV